MMLINLQSDSLFHIISFLEITDIINCLLYNKYMNNIINNNLPIYILLELWPWKMKSIPLYSMKGNNEFNVQKQVLSIRNEEINFLFFISNLTVLKNNDSFDKIIEYLGNVKYIDNISQFLEELLIYNKNNKSNSSFFNHVSNDKSIIENYLKNHECLLIIKKTTLYLKSEIQVII